MIGAVKYRHGELDERHLQGLYVALEMLTSECQDDLRDVFRNVTGKVPGAYALTDTIFESVLPAKHAARYDYGTANNLLTCMYVVGQKLASPRLEYLACVGEELALWAIIQRAEGNAALDVDEDDLDFDAFMEVAYDDQHFRDLFKPEEDGFETGEDAAREGLHNLELKDWFKSFREETPVHPLVHVDELVPA